MEGYLQAEDGPLDSGSPWPMKHKVCPARSGCVLTPLGVSHHPGRRLVVPR